MEEILNAAVLCDIPYDLLEDAILNHIIGGEQRTPSTARFGRHEFWTSLSDDEAIDYFRFSKGEISRLVEVLGIPSSVRTEERYVASGVEALAFCLRRLAYPNRLVDLEPLFGVSSSLLSAVINKTMKIVENNKGHLLQDLGSLMWLNKERMKLYAQRVADKGAAMRNCWGFIDGTARPICRPSENQQNYFSGHKRIHCLKYQSVLCPDGLIVSLHGAYPGRRHDAGIYRESQIEQQLEKYATFPTGEKFALYGDPAYPIGELLLCPYGSRYLTPEQQNFNSSMSAVRQAVEWGFGKVVSLFAFMDFRKNNKLLLQEVETMYRCAVLFSNCHTCLYGSQASVYFNTPPPTLEEYLCC